ncbi:GrpB family protein [Paenibacillus oenotherae]|uniref:GrpB family protein n=1 Tax=Paenibacillus oenotherae TaxID=1435645 RepID=A0ABS7D3L7_9BACL|nr:GrpB family protein [Paenibacillus oenotherae]MBW7474524.1 GrpB family protein [Paenibacillus oenotherae]
MRRTEIAPWTENWFDLYRKEEVLLQSIFSKELLEIHHIGSTSVPQIGFAKPIIDILIVVKDIIKVDEYNEQMILIGYKSRGEQGIVGRRYFSKGGDNRTHHVHIYEAGNINIKYHLNFKEYLINHPEEAKAYGELKLHLAKQSPDNVHLYQDGKEAFCNGIVKKAMKWASHKEENRRNST